MKKKAKKKRIKLKSVLVFILVLGVVGFLTWYLLCMRIRNIYVKGNVLIKEEEILEISGLILYPRIIDIDNKEIINKLLTNDLIENAKISKSLFGKVVVEIDEKKVLFKDSANNYYLDNGKLITNPLVERTVPLMSNEMPNNDILEKFIRKYKDVSQDIRLKISEIEYCKDDLDNEKFLFYMLDGNYVYITLSKIDLINSYNDIYAQLGDNRGVLYLDSGNHFQIKNNNE